MPGMSVAFVQEKRLRAVQRRKEEVEEKEMKSVLISIQPKWCELIANGKKTIEVRKSRPKIETPFKCYIYMTATKERCRFWEYITAYKNNKGDIVDGSQKVIGEFVCDRIYEIKNLGSRFMIGNDIALTNRIARDSCLEFPDLRAYLKDKNGYSWHISKLKIYDKPKPIMQFYKPCPIRLGFKNCPGCESYSTYTGCCMNNVTRHPQSWCYVEE